MSGILELFESLKNKPSSEKDCFNVVPLSPIMDHKLGIGEDGQPLFFILTDNSAKVNFLDVSIELIEIKYNRACNLSSGGMSMLGNFTIVKLLSKTPELHEYFLDIVYLVLNKLESPINVMFLRGELDKLVQLFSKYTLAPVKTIQGLWAELLVIEQSFNPDYMLRSWHKNLNDKFDFNDGIDKIEVKSTKKLSRIHEFSSYQLLTNMNSQLVVASVLVQESGLGKSIFDLRLRILEKLSDKNLISLIDIGISETIGNDIEKSSVVFFDYNYSKDNLLFYSSEVIPKINSNHVPAEITNLRFDCDLSNLPFMDFINCNSKLIKSVQKG